MLGVQLNMDSETPPLLDPANADARASPPLQHDTRARGVAQATRGGLTNGGDGASQQACEDIAIARSLLYASRLAV